MKTPAPNPLAVVYTVDQFCAMMQHSRDKFEDLVRRGELAAFKVGRRTYVAKAEAERWLRKTQSLNKVPSATPDPPPASDRGSGRSPAA
jgi:excisionase family DNA binding protein